MRGRGFVSSPTAEGAAQGRAKTLRLGVATSILQRLVGAVIPLVSVPLALGHLGEAGYGAWAAAVAITSVFVFSDLGVGTGLMTRVGSLSEASLPEARTYVSSAYLLVGGLILALLGGLFVAASILNLARVFGADAGPGVEAILVLTMAGFLVNILVSLVVRVQYAIGQQAASNMWQTAGSLVLLLAIWLASRYTTGPAWFISAAAFAPVVTGILNSTWFYRFDERGKLLAPHVRRWRPEAASEVLRLGAKFAFVSALMALTVALDPWIIANTTALEEVPNYAVPYRVLTVAGLMSVAAVMPLWPLHARAVGQGDLVWIKSITWRMTAIATGGMMLVVGSIVTLSEPLVGLWLNGEVEVVPGIWWGIALMAVAQAATGPMFMLQNGAEVLAPQIIGYLLVLFSLPLKWVVSSHVGYHWVPWVTFVAYVAFVGPACVIGYRKALALATPEAV